MKEGKMRAPAPLCPALNISPLTTSCPHSPPLKQQHRLIQPSFETRSSQARCAPPRARQQIVLRRTHCPCLLPPSPIPISRVVDLYKIRQMDPSRCPKHPRATQQHGDESAGSESHSILPGSLALLNALSLYNVTSETEQSLRYCLKIKWNYAYKALTRSYHYYIKCN